MKRVAMLLALFAAASACGNKTQAKMPGPVPSLTMPDPPGRLVVPVNIEPPAMPTTADRPAPVTSPRPAGTRPTPTPAATPSPSPTPEVAPPVLQTSVSLAEIEQKARATVDRAQKDLGRLSRQSLGKDAQDQFDSAERYIRMAKDAITVKNFVYA